MVGLAHHLTGDQFFNPYRTSRFAMNKTNYALLKYLVLGYLRAEAVNNWPLLSCLYEFYHTPLPKSLFGP